MIFPNYFAMLENEFMSPGAISRVKSQRFRRIASQLLCIDKKKGPGGPKLP
jgi:hypothetical protein